MLLLPNLNSFGTYFKEVLDMHTTDEELLQLYAYFHEEIAKELLESKPFYDEPMAQNVLAMGAVMRTYVRLKNIFEERTKSEQFYLLYMSLIVFTPKDYMENTSIELFYRCSYDRLFHFFRIAKTREIANTEATSLIQQYKKIFALIV